ncbi:hypothetical protein KJ835_01640 [Patescibacteria group bacterium]|nr:hypothetical protein [Patescibacteria group bacterium]
MSDDQVKLVLRLERKFEDKPVLKTALIKGEVSVNKLSRVASIAMRENQEELVELAKKLPQRALETFVKDEKLNGFNKTKDDVESLHVHSNPQQSLPDVNLLEHLAHDLQKDLIARHEKGININALLKELLQKHDEEIEEQKAKMAEEDHAKKTSRYIPAKIRHLLRKEHGTACTMRNCGRQADTVHHTQRFALSGNHDPNFLAQLCKEHHMLAHAIDGRVWEKRHR